MLPTPYLVALASWMHGLNTSLGTGFENIAHIISGGLKRKFTAGYTLMVSAKQDATISMIMSGLKSGRRVANLVEEDTLLAASPAAVPKEQLQEALGFTADVYIETASSIECIELKSVRPNSGEGRGEKEKILYAKAALKRLNPNKIVTFYIGFPFDPTSKTPTGYDKERFMNHLIEFKKFFSPNEVLVASELWDHLSGSPNTMEQILEITARTVDRFCSRGRFAL
jgi:hypothetical protein